MRRSAVVLFAALMTFIAAMPLLARDQLSGPVSFKVDFPFTAGNTRFPAGSYELRPLAELTGVMEIMSSAGAPSALVEVQNERPAAGTKTTEVNFDKYAGGHVLKSVWLGESSQGVLLVASHASKQHAKTGTPTPVKVSATKK